MGSLVNLSSGALVGNRYVYKPLTFDIQTNGTIAWVYNGSGTGLTIEYSKNHNAWTAITATNEGVEISVTAGDRLEFRGENTAYSAMESGSWAWWHTLKGTASFDVSGHICSLIGGGDTISATHTYYSLFMEANVVSAQNLILADNVTTHCYNGLFRDCTSLTTPPALPATTLAEYCYSHLFNGCTSLATAPVLPATTMAAYCYRQMFGGCASLVVAPTLPAETLANYCYRYMFFDCSSLTTPPTLPSTTLATGCYYNMFRNCTSLDTAPTLPAKTLVSNCYYNMFYGCSSLSEVTVRCTTAPSATYSENWLYGVASSGTFKRFSTSWTVTRNASCVPSNWTVQTVSD